jgi:hypothetical protein
VTYVTIARIDGDPDMLLEGYRQTAEVMDGVGRDHELIMHLAAATDDGLMIINVWPSPERSEQAAADPRRRAVVAGHQLRGDLLCKEHHEVDRLVVFEDHGLAGTYLTESHN